MPISADDPHLDDRETTSVAVELRGIVDLDALVSAAARHAASCHAAVDVVAVAPEHAILHLTHRGAGPIGPLAAIASTYAAGRPTPRRRHASAPATHTGTQTAAATGERPHADVVALYPSGVAARTLSLTASRLVRACARRHDVGVDMIVTAAHTALAASLGSTGTVIAPEGRLAGLIRAIGDNRHGSGATGHRPATNLVEVGPLRFGDVFGDVFILDRSGADGSGIRVYEAAGERIRVDLVDTPTDDDAANADVADDRLDRLVTHLQWLAAADLAAPGRTTLGPFDVAGTHGRRMMQRWNDTREVTIPATVTDLVDLALARHPDAIAFSGEPAGEPVSYGEIDCRINQVARTLVAAGVGTDVVVGVMCVDPLWATIATIAVFRAGGGVLAIAVDGTASAVAELIDVAAPMVVVTDQVLTDTDIDPDDVMTEFVRHVGVADIVTGADTAPEASDAETSLARNLFDAIPPWMPTIALDPAELAEHPDDPICPTEVLGIARLQSVALVGRVGGADTAPVVIDHGALAQRLQWTTEETDVTASTPTDADRTLAMVSALLVGATIGVVAADDRRPATPPLGAPHALTHVSIDGGTVAGWNTEMYVLDDCLRLLPPGMVGRLYVGGDHIGRAYAGPSATTSARFVANPFRPGERMVATDTAVRRAADGSVVEVAEAVARDPAIGASPAAHTPVGRSGVARRTRGHA